MFHSMGALVLTDGGSAPQGTHEVGGLDIAGNLIQTELSFTESGGVVRSIAIHGLGQHRAEEFRRLWEAYSPQNVLSLLGTPSSIWIDSARSEGPSQSFGLWFFYDAEGILVQYSGLAAEGETLRICPTFVEPSTISSVRIMLQDASSHTSLEDLLPYDLDRKYTRDVETATGLSIEEATAAMLSEASACFYWPAEIWPS